MPRRFGLFVPVEHARKLDTHVKARTGGCRSRGERVSSWLSSDYPETAIPTGRPGDFRDSRSKITDTYRTNEQGQYMLVVYIPEDQAVKLATLGARVGVTTTELIRRCVAKHAGDNTPMPEVTERIALPYSLVSDLRALAEIQGIPLEALAESVLRAALTESLL